MGWNGYDFIEEMSQKLGDTRAVFKDKIEIWMNDGILDIATKHNWAFLRVLGRKTLTANLAEQDLLLSAPTTVPTLTITTGGSLTNGSVYKLRMTYIKGATGQESTIGAAPSAGVTATATDKTANITNLQVSSDPLVTDRAIYISKDGGPYLFAKYVGDNSSTSVSVDAEAVGNRQAPEFGHNIKSLDGNPFIDDLRSLSYKPLDQIIMESQATSRSGTPNWWAQVQEEIVYLYPAPSSALELRYYYFRMPTYVRPSYDDIIGIPTWLKPDLERYVVWRGYEYRDRDGQESKFNNYEQMIKATISQKGSQKKVAARVRDVTGNSDGYTLE